MMMNSMFPGGKRRVISSFATRSRASSLSDLSRESK